MNSASLLTGVVLAGGRGRRMGGADKGLLPWRGQPLVMQALAGLRPQVAQLAISANRNLARYAAFGVPVLPDENPDFDGPLAGMLAGLRHAATPWVLYAPCDALCIPADLGRRLHAAASTRKAVYASADGEALYACCLLHRSLADEVAAALNEGQRSVWQFLAANGAAAVNFPAWPLQLCNVNTPRELALFSP